MKARDPRPIPSPSSTRARSQRGGDKTEDGRRQRAPAGPDGRAILRVSRDRDHPYTIMNNTPLRDTRLSWKARGRIGYLLTMPDDWRVMVCHLLKQSPCGRDATYTGLRELEVAGYIRRSRARDERGRIVRTEYVVCEIPQEPEPSVGGTVGAEGVDPHTGFPYTDNPYVENPPLLMNPDPDPEDKRLKSNQPSGSGRRARDPRGVSATPEPRSPGATGGRHVAAAPEPAPTVPARGVALLASPGGDRESPTAATPEGLPAGPEPVILDAAVPNVADSDQVPAVPEPAQPQAPMDAAAICAAYSARTGLDDLLPEALDTLSRRRALTEAYVTAKLSLLGDALVAGTVHNPRGFLLRAVEGDWTPATAPASRRRSLRPHRAIPARSTASVPTPRGTAPGSGLPAAAIPPVVARDAGAPAQLAAALVQLGVVPPTAERLVRAQPDEVGRQLSWIAYRHAQDPAALIVRAIGERWPEPAVVRQERMADAEREQTRAQLAAIEEARTLALSPSGREAARRGFAQIREMLSPSATSPPTVGRTAP